MIQAVPGTLYPVQSQAVKTIRGWVGQLTYGEDILWESEPFDDQLDDDGKVVKTAQTFATEAAGDHRVKVLKEELNAPES